MDVTHGLEYKKTTCHPEKGVTLFLLYTRDSNRSRPIQILVSPLFITTFPPRPLYPKTITTTRYFLLQTFWVKLFICMCNDMFTSWNLNTADVATHKLTTQGATSWLLFLPRQKHIRNFFFKSQTPFHNTETLKMAYCISNSLVSNFWTKNTSTCSTKFCVTVTRAVKSVH